MALAAKILIEHFSIVADLNGISNITGIMQEKKVDTMTKTLETLLTTALSLCKNARALRRDTNVPFFP